MLGPGIWDFQRPLSNARADLCNVSSKSAPLRCTKREFRRALVHRYDTPAQLLTELSDRVIKPSEAKASEFRSTPQHA
jgi:hypothetical protein